MRPFANAGGVEKYNPASAGSDRTQVNQKSDL